MKKRLRTILKIIATITIICCIVFSVSYLKITIPSERELWRIADNNLSDPILLNDFLLFKGGKGKHPSICEYIYAVNKNTGEVAWSSESFTDQYCDHSLGSVYTAIILLAEKDDLVFVSTTYWTTNDEQEYVLYALNSSNGDLLWEADGYAGYPYSGNSLLKYTMTDTNYIYIASKEGSFSAIDFSTGKQAWQHKLPTVNYDEDNLIEYNDQIVFYSGNHSLTAFNAIDGSQIWEIANLNDIDQILFSDNLVYLVSRPDNQDAYIAALDTMTGEGVWKLSLKSYPWAEIIGDKVYLLSHGGEGSFDDFKTRCGLVVVNENTGCSLIVVNKNTGELAWYFNEDYLHGSINYLFQDNVVYIGTNDGFIFALDEKTGKAIWQTKASGVPYYFRVEGDTLVVVCQEKYASGFDIKTGKQKWMLDVGMDISWYPDDFIVMGDGNIYIAGAANRQVYGIDVTTGKVLWSWNHWHPRDRAYMLKALDNDILYVDQYRRFLGYDWFFALKTEP
jgi:outer membrane protein assembly factor BamB